MGWPPGKGETNRRTGKKHGHGQYLKWIDKLPGILKFVPAAGGLRDVKNYLNIFCYFLQPTPANIRSMVLYRFERIRPGRRLKKAQRQGAAARAYAVSGDLPS